MREITSFEALSDEQSVQVYIAAFVREVDSSQSSHISHDTYLVTRFVSEIHLCDLEYIHLFPMNYLMSS